MGSISITFVFVLAAAVSWGLAFQPQQLGDGRRFPRLAAREGTAMVQEQQDDFRWGELCIHGCGKFWNGDLSAWPKRDELYGWGDMVLAKCMTVASGNSWVLGWLEEYLQKEFVGFDDQGRWYFDEYEFIRFAIDNGNVEWFHKALLTYTVAMYHRFHREFVTDVLKRWSMGKFKRPADSEGEEPSDQEKAAASKWVQDSIKLCMFLPVNEDWDAFQGVMEELQDVPSQGVKSLVVDGLLGLVAKNLYYLEDFRGIGIGFSDDPLDSGSPFADRLLLKRLPRCPPLTVHSDEEAKCLPGEAGQQRSDGV